MKKVCIRMISVFLMLAMIFSLAACGKSGSSDSKKEGKTQYLTIAACPASSGNYAFFVGMGQAISKVYPEYNLSLIHI